MCWEIFERKLRVESLFMIFHFCVDSWKSGRHASIDTGLNQFIKVVVHHTYRPQIIRSASAEGLKFAEHEKPRWHFENIS